MSLSERVATFISRQELLVPGQTLLVAVSGGPDSLCLLHLLLELGYRPHIAHLDHALRPESAAEADTVRSVAARWQLPITVERLEAARWEGEAGSVEESARRARYRFLVGAARQAGLATIATGHTWDDQVETILMHLLRGAGPAGLAGMRPLEEMSGWPGIGAAEGLQLVRPLLGLRAEDTAAYCQEHGLQPVRDPSNRNLAFLRNRLRHELLPVLRQYNPQVDEALARTGEIMRAIVEWLEAEVATRWDDLARPAGAGALALSWDRLQELPRALQRELLRRAYRQLRPRHAELDFEATERAVRFLNGPGEDLCTLPSGLRLERAGEELIVMERGAAPAFPHVPQLEGPRDLGIPGRTDLGADWELISEAEVATERVDYAVGLGEATAASDRVEILDLERTVGALRLRRPDAGDRFQPLGMEGNMLLSDFFINEKVPRLQRARWPLLVDDAGILWVVGLRISDRARVGPGTEKLLRLRLRAVAN